MTSFVDGLPNDIIASLTISVEQLQALSVQFQEEIDRGLTGDRSSLKMLQTFAQQPRGDEQGRVIVVDWGGTHGRVVMVDLQGSGKYAVLHQKDLKFTDAQKTSSAEIVFGIIAEAIKQVIGKDQQRSYSLGFIYSFPARLEKINKAIALPMTKGWHLTGLQGKDVVELLTLALQKQGLTNVTVSAVANDTVAPMVLHTYCTKGQHPTAKPTEIGLILGTGTNQAVDLPSLGIYNMESGNFSGVISVHTCYDRQLDQELRDPPPGAQLFEKMVSGQYLGELVRRILYELVLQKVLSWAVVEVLQTPFAFETSSLSRIAKDPSPTLRDVEFLLQEFGIQSTLPERRLVKEIAHTVVRRSARLVAASVAGTLRKIDPSWAEEHTIAVDGSLYGRYPGYDQMVQTTLAEIIGVDRAQRIQWVFVHNSTSAGAAVIAAVASREGFSEGERILLKKEDKGREVISRLINRLGEVSRTLDLRKDNKQCHPSQFTNCSYLQELQERDITIQRILSELALDPSTARYVLDWLTSQLDSSAFQTLTRLGWTELQAATVLRLLQYIICTARPIFTNPHFSFYPWAGKTLQKLYGIEKPASESWPFFSDLKGVGPAQICDTAIAIRGNRLLEAITLRDLVRRVPAVLGPAGIDPQNRQQKYFFVKFLDPSDFPPLAYVGFRPETVYGLENFQTYFAGLLWKDRQSLEALYHLVAPQIQSESTFRLFEAAYKTWAIAQALRDWNGEFSIDTLSSFVPLSRISELKTLLTEQQKNRQQVVRCMHRIDYQEGQAILIPSPTLHAIAGLSGQFHPNTAENYHPKDELWIFKTIYDTEGQKLGWILVEPQRLFDKTESGFDFFTPFSWTEKGFGFRKAISQESLTDFVHLMDARPRPREAYLFFAEAITLPEGTTSEGAQWYAIVDDERIWPFFLVHELRFKRIGGTATVPFTPHSFSEVHVTQGVVEMTLGFAEGPPLSITITPARPVFLPASLPCRTVTYTATGAAQLQVFRRRP